MKKVWNNKTKQYDYYKKESEKTFLERYADELGVDEAKLLENILKNNSFDYFTSCNTYFKFRLLKQTLVKENNTMTVLKTWANIAGKGFY